MAEKKRETPSSKDPAPLERLEDVASKCSELISDKSENAAVLRRLKRDIERVLKSARTMSL
ncbi:hypothetical protein [Limisalsivibrio acetivorans]|uniref:hypothetical protein n=1 Tax=Limisalsivibrio acetivorans TaxID=1304888 RepID=UPI0003B35D60|nr:hypothetical protein [Limisalsivibrio acetivorans]